MAKEKKKRKKQTKNKIYLGFLLRNCRKESTHAQQSQPSALQPTGDWKTPQQHSSLKGLKISRKTPLLLRKIFCAQDGTDAIYKIAALPAPLVTMFFSSAFAYIKNIDAS